MISDDTIPGAKILFAAGDVNATALATDAVTTVKIQNDAVTATKLADESTVDLVTTLPAAGAFTGQLAVDTDDNSLYCWNGSAWLSLKAGGSINSVAGSTVGIVDITAPQPAAAVTLQQSLTTRLQPTSFAAQPALVVRLLIERLMAATFLLRQAALRRCDCQR